jgi:AraC family transcriptional regulator
MLPVMRPVSKALWFIESHFAGELSLEDVAEASGVGRFHLARAFEITTGLSVMRYVRARRLTEAARQLAAGAPDILQLALQAGYASHEAFTRAFRTTFGLTPEQLRATGDLTKLPLMEPSRMDKEPLTPIAEPRLVEGPAMTLGGLKVRYAYDGTAGIPAQWQRFNALEDEVPGRTGDAAYGVCMNDDGTGFDYIACVEVRPSVAIGGELTRLSLAAETYAVFTHRGRITEMRATFDAIWNGWFPKSGRKMAEAPLFERYGPEFDAHTGNGGFEIWIPLKA